MNSYGEKAIEYFESGYNCAQSVLMSFADKYGIEQNFALKLAASFGGGMGRLREVCGAVSAMFIIAGLNSSYTIPNDDIKKEHYELIQKLANEFKDLHKSIICRDLLGLPDGADSPIPSKRTKEYYESRPCANYIKTVCEIIEKHFVDEKL